LDDALAFAINQRPVSRDASSIAQTDVQHFADEEVMRNSRASPVEVARSTGFADQRHLTRVFRRSTGITPSTYRRSLKSLETRQAT
jgi:AraC-like DNA-binding protein